MNRYRYVQTAAHRLTRYLVIIKGRQTCLLVLTGIAGYTSLHPTPFSWAQLIGLTGSLLTAISGATIFNMVYDRDIDRKMIRTSQRPMATGDISPQTALIAAYILTGSGLVWAAVLAPTYGLLVLLGVILDVLVYTLWLKRRTAWSIVWGGLAGGLPFLAGTVLALGTISKPALLIAAAIVSWIPSHNLTLQLRYSQDYSAAGVPTFLERFGPSWTRASAATSSLLTSGLMVAGTTMLTVSPLLLVILVLGSAGLVFLAGWLAVKPDIKVMAIHFKASSIYMLLATLVLVCAAFIG